MDILSGKKIASEILFEVKNEIDANNLHPILGVILVGSDEASRIYVKLKGEAAQKNNIGFQKIEMAADVSEQDLLVAIASLNADEKINGIIVQLPLPEHLDKLKIIQAIDPRKDVDGFHKENIALFLNGQERFSPVFPNAMLEILKSVPKVQPSENRRFNLRRKAVIICNSQEFGQMMQAVLKKSGVDAQYFFRNELLNNLINVKNADIIITACGEPSLIKGEMLKSGVIIIDGGITRVGDKVVGDVDSESAQNLSGYLSPVPGGVGPVTIACLLRNVYLASKNM
jgi:methylenetetrahydrofolate dehydrogenase (NADP+)/methenyltetrahydrofolate cyclohydrolase